MNAILGAILFAVAWGSSAAAVELDFDHGVDARLVLAGLAEGGAGEGPASTPGSAAVRPRLAEWAILYFINGKNNLDGYVEADLNHMEEVGSSDQVKIVAQVGRSGAGVKRYLMRKDEDPGSVTSPVQQDMGASDMGDWRTLADFGLWAKANYPAKRYLLSIWNHGSGWVKARQERPRAEGISYDDETGHHMTTQELARALAAMGGVDVYASDACLMQMAEVAYELRQYAGVVLGSEDNEPGAGWNYAYYLGPLAADPAMGPAQLSRNYVEAFRRSYAAMGRDTTHSAVDAGAFRELVPLVGAWTAAVIAADEQDLVKRARRQVQAFSNSDNVDLIHLVGLIGEGTGSAGVRSAGQRLSAFLRERMLLASSTTGNRHGNASGLAVYLPTGPVSGDYAELAWAKDSGWPTFARWVAGLFTSRPGVVAAPES